MNEQIKKRIEQVRHGEVPEGYKREKLGVVPQAWNKIPFSTLFSGSSNYTDDFAEYPLYSLTIEDGVTAKTERYERSHLVKKNDSFKIVQPNEYAYNPMNIRFGAVARHKGNVPVSISGYYDIFSVTHPSDIPFMDSFLTCGPMIIYYNKVSTGSLVEKQRVHFSQFIDFVLPLPDIDERAEIAAILTTQDKVIELKEKLLAEKQRQKKYLCQQLLTGKKRLPGFSGEWGKTKLSDVMTAGCKQAVDNTSDYQKITIKLNFNGIEFTKTSRVMADTRPFYVRKKGEIIIGKQNYFNGSIALVSDQYDGCICSNAIMSFTVHGAHSKFLLEYLSQDNFLRKHKMLANGTGQKELSEKDFLNFTVTAPELNEQSAIAEILSTADQEISLLQKFIDAEKQKKKALMQLLLTGIVRVKAL